MMQIISAYCIMQPSVIKNMNEIEIPVVRNIYTKKHAKFCKMVKGVETDIFYIQLLKDFIIPLYLPEEYLDYNQRLQNIRRCADVLRLEGAEVLAIKYFIPKPSHVAYTSGFLNFTYYAFIVGYYKVGYYKNDIFINVNKKCAMSKDFIDVNKKIFSNITTTFRRELKINNILQKNT